MMPRDLQSYRQSLVEANPGLSCDSGEMTISVASFLAQIDRAYNHGDADRLAAMAAAKALSDKTMPNPFGDLLGGPRR